MRANVRLLIRTLPELAEREKPNVIGCLNSDNGILLPYRMSQSDSN